MLMSSAPPKRVAMRPPICVSGFEAKTNRAKEQVVPSTRSVTTSIAVISVADFVAIKNLFQ